MQRPDYREPEDLARLITPKRLPDHAPISDVEPLRYVSGMLVERATAAAIIEQPLVEACLSLAEKKITTSLSSANVDDIGRGYGALFIEYNQLTPENQRVADSEAAWIIGVSDIGTRRTDRIAEVHLTVNWESTVGSVRTEANRIADRFQPQERRFPYPLREDEIAFLLKTVLGINNPVPRGELRQLGLFDYESESDEFYLRA